MNDLNVSSELARMQSDLDSIRDQFDEADKEFHTSFDSSDYQIDEGESVSLGVFIECVGRYRHWQGHSVICDMVAKFDSLVALQSKSTASLACLLGSLDEMASIESSHDEEEHNFVSFEAWLNVTGSFQSFITSESKFLEALTLAQHASAPR